MENFEILIVDDDEMLRDIYDIILHGAFDCKLIIAKDGTEAISQLQNNSNISLIITDYGMPNKNGADIFNFNKQNKNTPIFILSGGDFEDYSDISDLFTSNPLNRFISKPFDDSDLVDEVKIFVNRQQRQIPKHTDVGNSELIKIYLKHYIKYATNSSEVYLNLHGEKFTKILNHEKNTQLDHGRLDHFLKKNIEFVYITKNDYLLLVAETVKKLKTNLHKNFPPNEILNIAGLQFHISLSGLNSIGVTALQVELVTEIIDETISEISKIPSSQLIYKELFASEGYLIGHSIITMMIAGSLCRETQLNFKTTMKRICLAGFFHDLSLETEENCLNELSLFKIEDEKLFQQIINHPIESAKMLPELKEVLDDTKRIILEHHEMPNGDGYPRKLTATQIAPISCLFILAHQITACLIRNDFDKNRLNDFIKNNEFIFKQGNFTKFYTVAASKFLKQSAQ